MDQTGHFPVPDDESLRKVRLTQMLDEARVWLHQEGRHKLDYFVPADEWISYRDELVARKLKEPAMTTTRILWLDLETTGLDPFNDHILEVGALITDGDFNEVARAEWTLQVTRQMVAVMHPYVHDMHVKSGLVERCLAASKSMPQVDRACLSFCAENGVTKASFLAGNSVGDFDRHFMRRLMPLTNESISHRSINVSTFKALYSIWNPAAAAPVLARAKAHRSILDCEHAIAELKYWLSLPVPAQFKSP